MQRTRCDYGAGPPTNLQPGKKIDANGEIHQRRLRQIQGGKAMRTPRSPGRVVAGGVIGLVYGSLLAFLAIGAAGAGHGIYIPIWISSAPFGFLTFLSDAGTEAAFFTGAPIVWATFGALVAQPGGREWRRTTCVLILLHCLSGLALVVAKTDSDEYAHVLQVLRMFPEVPLAWTFCYLAGQAIVWWRVIGRGEAPPGSVPDRSGF